MKHAIIVMFLLVPLGGFCQSDTLNRIDSEGERTGFWKITCAMNKETCDSPQRVLEEGTYVHGEKSGMWIEYYPTGIIKSRIQYKKGNPSGSITRYYENGNIAETGIFKKYRWVGEYRSYYTNDSLYIICQFDSSGAISGDRFVYWPNGKIMTEEHRVRGINHGWFRWYYENGLIEKEMRYENGVAKDYNKYPENAPVYTGVEGPKSYPCVPGCECECKDNEIISGKVYIFDDKSQIIRIDIYRNRQYTGFVKVE